MCLSYSEDLTDKFAHDCAKIMRSDWVKELFPDCKLIRETKEWLETSQGRRPPLRHRGRADHRLRSQRHHPGRSDQASGRSVRRLAHRQHAVVPGHLGLAPGRRGHRRHHARHAAPARGRSRRPAPAEALLDAHKAAGDRPGGHDHRYLRARAPTCSGPARRSTPDASRWRRWRACAPRWAGTPLPPSSCRSPVTSVGAMLQPAWFATSPASLTVSPGDYIVQSWTALPSPAS